MKCATAIAAFLALHVRHVFGVSGGACLHLFKAIADRDGLMLICPQHEQSASFAADACARLTGMGCALTTSGPGATNLITGIASSWYDSVPVLYLTGNQTVERIETHGTRGYGFQATPIVEIVRPITKWAITVMDAKEAINTLELAVQIAKDGRPGPVLVDFPDDVQRCEI